MNFKNKIVFFLLSFFLSSAIFFTCQKFLAHLINNDIKAYGMAILSISIVPLVIYFIWPKMNKKLLTFFYIVCFLFIIITLLQTDFTLLKVFFTANIRSIINILFFSLIINSLLKINFQNQWFRSFTNTDFVKFMANLSVFLLIFFLIYNPKYKYSFEKLSFFGYESFHQFHHVTFFAIPIHEIINGKTLLVNVSSLYGILLTYFNSFVFKIIGLTYSRFVLYSTLLAITYTYFFFIVLKKITKNFWLALIGTLTYIRLVLFRGYPPNVEVFILPSTTPIRYFFDLIVINQIFEYFCRPASSKRLLIMTIIVITGFFFNFDFGLLILLSYIATILFDIFLSFVNKEKWQKIVSKFTLYSLTFVLTFIFFGLFIILATYFRSGVFPNFLQYLFHISTQDTLLATQTFNTISWQYLPLSIYLIGFYFIFYQTLINKEKSNQWLVFPLVYGLFSYIYYINLNEPNHLFGVIHPSILIFITLLSVTINKLIRYKTSSSFFVFLIPIFFFTSIFWVIFTSPELFTSMIAAKIDFRYSPINNKYYYWNYPGTDFYLQDDDGKNFKLAADKIKQYAKSDQEIVIISRYSALLYLMSGKTSLINHPNLEYDFFSIEELNEAINLIKMTNPKYIFYNSLGYDQTYPGQILNFDFLKLFWEKINKNYVFKENAGAVDVYQRITSLDQP